MDSRVAIIGGGLAGCEAAWMLARLGIPVTLFEMKPTRFSPAHRESGLAELVCSNSLRSDEPDTAIGLLKEEMRSLESLTMEAAKMTRVPAGKALAVDRSLFSAFISEKVENHPSVSVVRREIASLSDPSLQDFSAVILSAGPLASDALATDLAALVGETHLYFYDAIAPIVSAGSIDMDRVFAASRYRPEETDYLNCPMTEGEYRSFIAALKAGQKVPSREFEKELHFEGCLPVETMAERGEMTLAFGPMKPVGLPDPKTGREPFAVVQLRTENLERTMFNLVGFQTKLTYPEQERIFRMIPGLERTEFVRLGSIHRNTFVNAPRVLSSRLELNVRPGVYLAGQIAGVEGYVESAACGLWLGLDLGKRLLGATLELPPETTALGGLLKHLRTPNKHFQPMNANFGLTPDLKARGGKKRRKELYAERAKADWAQWLQAVRLGP